MDKNDNNLISKKEAEDRLFDSIKERMRAERVHPEHIKLKATEELKRSNLSNLKEVLDATELNTKRAAELTGKSSLSTENVSDKSAFLAATGALAEVGVSAFKKEAENRLFDSIKERMRAERVHPEHIKLKASEELKRSDLSNLKEVLDATAKNTSRTADLNEHQGSGLPPQSLPRKAPPQRER